MDQAERTSTENISSIRREWLNWSIEMEILNILFIILLVLTFRKREKGDPFSLQSMNVMKGVAIAGVFIGHTSKEFLGLYLYKFLCSIGLFSVSIFFFVSGYGLMYGAIHKPLYQKNFFSKRIWPIVFCYFVACLLQWGINGFSPVSLTDILSCDYVPFSWYIFSIIWLYVFFYLTMRMVSVSKRVGFIMTESALLIIYALICYSFLGSTKGFIPMITFIIGSVVASSEKMRQLCLSSSVFVVFVVLFLILWGIQLSNKYVNYPCFLLDLYEPVVSYIFPFIALKIFSCYKFPHQLEKMWLFLQRHSLQIYLTHGIVLFMVIRRIHFPSELSAFIVLIITLVLSVLMYRMMTSILKKNK